MNSNARVFGMRVGTRERRRWVVIALYASYVAACVLASAARDTGGSARIANLCVMLASFAVLWACWSGLAAAVREYGFPGDARILTSRDERQVLVRHQAFVRSYQIFSAAICGGIVYAMTAPVFEWWLPSGSLKSILFSVIFLSATLPSAVMSWTEPDEAPEDLRDPGRALQA